MKKSFVVGTLMIGLLFVSVSCSNPEKKAIKHAQAEIQIEESEFFGKYPSLCERKEKAMDNLQLIYDEKKAKIDDFSYIDLKEDLSEKTEKKLIKAVKKSVSLEVQEKEDIKELEQYYTEQIQKELKDINGKEIPVKADSKYYSNATAKLYCDVERENIYLHITVSIAPKNKMNWNGYRYNGNRLGYFFTDANGKAIKIDDSSIHLVNRDQKFKKSDVKREFYMPLDESNLADLRYGLFVTSVYK